MKGKNSKYRFLVIISILFMSVSNGFSEDLKTILNLTGYWRFKVGDNQQWAKADYNDNNWDKVYVPGSWEKEGYYGLDGYAWYRKTFTMPEYYDNETLILYIGKIDDCDQMYLNGKLIGQTGKMPPEYESGYNYNRKYILPKYLLNQSGKNTIAIRVYDGGMDGGIVNGSVKICKDEDNEYLSLNLAGNWKFHLYDNKNWKQPDYNDEKWDDILVPMYWESQGYINHDGYAWYRKSFIVSDDLLQESLYLVLGKIDDEDKVYLNGELIGTVFDLKDDSFHNRTSAEYNIRRGYRIPEGLLKKGKNTLAVRVYDGQIGGGIYEGPIGIMTRGEYYRYEDNHRYNQSVWEELLELFWD